MEYAELAVQMDEFLTEQGIKLDFIDWLESKGFEVDEDQIEAELEKAREQY